MSVLLHVLCVYRVLFCAVPETLADFPDPHFGRSHSSDRHWDRSSHPGDHSQRIWQLHHPNHCPSSQHRDELQQGHGPGQRPGVYKGSVTDCHFTIWPLGWNSFPSWCSLKLLCELVPLRGGIGWGRVHFTLLGLCSGWHLMKVVPSIKLGRIIMSFSVSSVVNFIYLAQDFYSLTLRKDAN